MNLHDSQTAEAHRRTCCVGFDCVGIDGVSKKRWRLHLATVSILYISRLKYSFTEELSSRSVRVRRRLHNFFANFSWERHYRRHTKQWNRRPWLNRHFWTVWIGFVAFSVCNVLRAMGSSSCCHAAKWRASIVLQKVSRWTGKCQYSKNTDEAFCNGFSVVSKTEEKRINCTLCKNVSTLCQIREEVKICYIPNVC